MRTRPTSSTRVIWLIFGLLLSSLLGVATNAGTQEALVSDLTREEMEQFLLRAEVVDIRSLSVGVTGSRRATLSDGKRTHDAHVQTVDIFNKKFTAGKKTEYNFRDYYGYNIAAYCLDKLLGLNMVPVSVKRRIRGDEGSVSWWVDGALMSGLEYKEGGHKPPDIGRFNDQKLQGWAFQQLVQNRDPNLGNFVIDKNWKVWMIDFTRAFRQWKQLDDVERLNRIPRGFLDRLRQLDPADVRRDLRPYLTKGELKGLLARREKLLEHFDRLIAEKGETAVLVDRSGS